MSRTCFLPVKWKIFSRTAITHFRVEFNGELYNIAAVDHMNYRRKSIKLSCEKVRR